MYSVELCTIEHLSVNHISLDFLVECLPLFVNRKAILNQIWMNATWFACLQRFKSRLQLWIWKYWNFGFISQSVDIQYVQRWKNAEFEREIFWKLVCVCFHALWAVCNRQEWYLRQDGGSDGKWQSYGSWCTVSLKGGFKSHKQIRKMFTLHSGTWKCAKSRSTKAEKIIPNKMKGFTCQLIVYKEKSS